MSGRGSCCWSRHWSSSRRSPWGPAGATTASEAARVAQVSAAQGRGPAERRPDDLELGALHRQEDDPGVRAARPASTVDYIEDINSYDEFFGKMQPLLAQGESGGRSLMVADRLAGEEDVRPRLHPEARQGGARAGVLEPEPGCQGAELGPELGLLDPVAGRDDRPDRQQASRPPTSHSINDLFDPKYKGKVEIVTELREVVPLVMKARGHRSRHRDHAGLAGRDRQAPAGGPVGADPPLHRRRLRQGPGRPATRSAVIGWAADAIQLQADNPDLQWRMPAEGCMLWWDDWVIPVGAPNPTAAYEWINYTYEPQAPGADRRLDQRRYSGGRASSRCSRRPTRRPRRAS